MWKESAEEDRWEKKVVWTSDLKCHEDLGKWERNGRKMPSVQNTERMENGSRAKERMNMGDK